MRFTRCYCVLLALLVSFTPASSKAIKIGVLSAASSDVAQYSAKFWQSWTSSASASFEPDLVRLPLWKIFDVNKAVCDLAKAGARAVVAPEMAANWLFPLFKSQVNALGMVALGPQNLLPDTAKATADLITYYRWKSFAFIYDTSSGPDHLHNVLSFLKESPVIEAFFRASTAHEAVTFVDMLPMNATRVLLATSEKLANELIADLRSNVYFEGILMQPVAYVEKTRSIGFHKLTKFEMIGSSKFSAVADFEHRWHIAANKTSVFQQKALPDSAIICHDMILVLSSLLGGIDLPDLPVISEPDCLGVTLKSPPPTLSQMAVVAGFTGHIQFNDEERRTGYNLTIIEATRIALKKLGQWTEETGLQLSSGHPIVYPSSSPLQTAPSLPAIKVTSVLNSPFLFRGSDGELEGFVVDLVRYMSHSMDRDFDINVVKDRYYGMRLSNGEWNGMIGELVRGEADVAIADLTKTQIRETAVDFGKTYLTFGLNILMHKPAHADKRISGPVWGPWFLWVASIAGGGLLSSAVGYGLSRFLGAPDRVRALELKNTDNLSPCGSCWFALGTLFGRDVGIYPRSFAHRLWSIIWWIFSFLILAAYISSLTSELIQRRSVILETVSRQSAHEVINDVLEKGWPSVGTVRGGSTFNFFKNSKVGVYGDLGVYLNQRPDLASPTNTRGAQRVRESAGQYAFIMESLLTQYHVNQKPCDLMMTPDYLATSSYALAMPKNSPLKDDLDHALLTLIEDGTLRSLYEIWWHNFTDYCEDPNLDVLRTVYQSSMTLREVSGVFYIFIAGAILSIVAALSEYFFVKRQSITL